ncbi:GcrA family cell cycle regulator, partial [Sphingobium sp. AM]
MSWTDERIDQLKAMWERGLTASQIADELGGVSRNAVIGKAHRLGLQSRPSPVKANEVPKKAAPPLRKSATEAEAPKPAAPAQHAAPPPARPAAPA